MEKSVNKLSQLKSVEENRPDFSTVASVTQK